MNEIKDKVDWKDIISKVFSWGFPAVFTILGIALTAAHKQLEIDVMWGVIIIILGLILYLIVYLVDTRVKNLTTDNKSLQEQVNKLELRIKELEKETLELKDEINKLMIENTKLNMKLGDKTNEK